VLLAVAALAALLVALIGYYAVDYFRYFGKWQLTYRQDFTRSNADVSGLSFSATILTDEIQAPRPGPQGLRLAVNQMAWLRDVREAGDVRFEAVVC